MPLPPRCSPGPAVSGMISRRRITTGASDSVASTGVAMPLAW